MARGRVTLGRALLSAVLFTSAGVPAVGAQLVEEGAFIARRGGDTVQVERFTRTDRMLLVDLDVRRPPMRQRYTATLTPDRLAPRFEIEIWAPGSAPGSAAGHRAELRLEGSTARLVQNQREMELPSMEGALPFIDPSFSLVEQVLRRARLVGGEISRVPVFLPSGGRSLEAEVRWLAGDSAVFTVGDTEMRLSVDRVGRLLGARSDGMVVERVRHPGAEAAGPGQDPSGRLAETGYGAPHGAPYAAEEVRVATEAGHELVGTLTVPVDRPGRLPAVLLLPGAGLRDRDGASASLPAHRPLREIADTLSRLGMAVLRLDARGHGDSGGSRSEATTAGFAEDARAAVTYLRSRQEIDPDRLALVGHGEGAAIALMLGASDPRIRALVLTGAAARPGMEVTLHQNRSSLEASGELMPAQVDSVLLTVRASLEAQKRQSPWARFYLEHDPAPDARRVRGSTLVVHGGSDRQVPVNFAEELHAILQPAPGGRKDLLILPGHNHLLVYDPWGNPQRYGELADLRLSPWVLGPVAEWLQRTLH
jgi:uncharacterized protein